MLKSSAYLQRSLVLDSGHSLVHVPKRNGILWKRVVHKEFGIVSRSKCCWNSLKADVLIFRATTPLSRGSLKIKGHGKLSIHFAADQDTIGTIFRIILFANQLSLYGAVANMCEEFEPHYEGSGQSDVLMGQSIILSEIQAKVPLVNVIPKHQNLLLQIYEERIELLSQEDKVSKFRMDAGFVHVVEIVQYFMTKDTQEQFFCVVMSWMYSSKKWWIIKSQRLDSGNHENWTCIGSYDQLSTWKNMELKSESGLWVEIILNPGSEILMDQQNLWRIQTSTTQKFLQTYLKNKGHNRMWRFEQSDRRQKQNHKEENLLRYRAPWMPELKQETNSILPSYWSQRQRASRSCWDWPSINHVEHNICTVLGRNIKTRYFGLILILQLRKGLTFYQTRSNAITFQGSLPAYCIPKVVKLKTGEVLIWEIIYVSSTTT